MAGGKGYISRISAWHGPFDVEIDCVAVEKRKILRIARAFYDLVFGRKRAQFVLGRAPAHV